MAHRMSEADREMQRAGVGERGRSRSRSPRAQRQGTPEPASSLTYLRGDPQISQADRHADIVTAGMSLAMFAAKEYTKCIFSRGDYMDTVSQKIAAAVKELGGVHRKAAQQLAARPDVFPNPKVRAALTDLFANNQFRSQCVIEKQAREVLTSYGGITIIAMLNAGTIGEVSLAQVNGTNDQYALKTTNPDQRDMYVTDFKIMASGLMSSLDAVFAKLEQISASAKKVRPVIQQVVNIGNDVEFQDDTMGEFDLRVEKRTMEKGQEWLQQAAQFFAYPQGLVRIPQVKEVSPDGSAMLMELMPGTNLVDRFPKGVSHDIKEKEKKEIAKILVELFVHGLVIGPLLHADLHPGNVIVSDGTSGVALVDWGITVVVPPGFRGTVCQLLQTLTPSKTNLTSNNDLRLLFQKLQCQPREQEIDYKQLGNLFNVMAQVKGISLPSLLKEMSRIQRPGWMIKWEKATGALVSSLVHLGVDADVLEGYYENALEQVSKQLSMGAEIA
jgi:predicted unusual protein kinase regulating ubiquinone biosynthesis (AarF/ABC1/UbiB family)